MNGSFHSFECKAIKLLVDATLSTFPARRSTSIVLTLLFLAACASVLLPSTTPVGYAAQVEAGSGKGGGAAIPSKLDEAAAKEAQLVNAIRRTRQRNTAQVDPDKALAGNWVSLFGEIRTIKAASTNEAWALTSVRGQLLHFYNGSWGDAAPAGVQGLYLSDIDLVSASDVWLTTSQSPGSKAFHYDGANWVELSNGLAAGQYLIYISALATNDVWAVGTSCAGSNCQRVVFHWNGTAWSQVASLGTTAISAAGIDMAAANDGWIVGTNYSSNTALTFHFDGANWSSLAPPAGAVTLSSISAPAGGDAWAAGQDGSSNAYQIYHYTAGAWSVSPTPAGSNPQGVNMLSPTEGWAAGNTGVLHWNGAAWAIDYSGRSLRVVSTVAGRVWAAGAGDTIVGKSDAGWALERGGPTSADIYAVSALGASDVWFGDGLGTYIHYNHGTWQSYPTTFGDHTLGTAPFDMQMVSATEGYAVGNGYIAKWDGTNWTQVATPNGGLYGISMLGSGEGWAVGSSGMIWHESGGVWSEARPRGSGRLLLGVHMDSASHGWAVGGTSSAEVVEYSGGAWVNRNSLLPSGVGMLYGVLSMPGGQEAWAGVWVTNSPSDQELLHYSAGRWSFVSGITGFGLTRFSRDGAPNPLVVGVENFRYIAGVWQSEAIPASILPFQGVAQVPNVEDWVVGYDAQIVYNGPAAPPTNTPLPTYTATGVPATATNTPVPATPTIGPGCSFSDVCQPDYFSTAVQYLVQHSIVGGYGDNTFRPYNNATRSQLAKIVVLARGWAIDVTGGPHFADVERSNTFYNFVETAYHHSAISGYSAAQCAPLTSACFKPFNNVTRAQLSKIIVNAMGWQLVNPATPTFVDVPRSHAFYKEIETAVQHGIISGYNHSGGGLEFRWQNNAIRGQICKIVYAAITAN